MCNIAGVLTGGYDKGPRVVKKLKRADGPPKHELGTPNPNVYKTTLGFGWPLTWITWEHSWNQAAGYDETELGGFQLINFVIHTLAILAPLLTVYWLSRSGSFAKRENSAKATLPS